MLRRISLGCSTQGYQNQFINSETWAVAYLYCSMIKDLNTNKIVKININIKDDWGALIDYYQSYKKVIIFRCHFDFRTYSKLNKFQRKKMQLEAIHNGMLQIAKHESWQTQPLTNAYTSCLENHLEHYFFVGKSKLSPNRKHKVNVCCNWDIDVLKVYCILYDKNNVQLYCKIILEKPSYDGEFIYFVKWKWLDNSKIVLEDKYKYGKNEKWEIDI